MTDLDSLVHAEHGPIRTFTTRGEAERELADVLEDEPGWVSDLYVESFELAVADES